MTIARHLGRLAKGVALAGLAIVVLAIGVLAWPQPAFAYHTAHGRFEIWSDRPIDPGIAAVIDDAERRIATSALDDPTQTFRLFFCHDDWRMALYSQHFSSGMGGVADGWLSRNIYIRRSDIAANRLIPAGEKKLADPDVRPLSYFVAHEAAHILTSRRFGRWAALRYPHWLMEGYADLIGKGGQFDPDENRQMLREGDPRLDPKKSGLYRLYHLMVVTALADRGGDVDALFASPPDEAALVSRLMAD